MYGQGQEVKRYEVNALHVWLLDNHARIVSLSPQLNSPYNRHEYIIRSNGTCLVTAEFFVDLARLLLNLRRKGLPTTPERLAVYAPKEPLCIPVDDCLYVTLPCPPLPRVLTVQRGGKRKKKKLFH